MIMRGIIKEYMRRKKVSAAKLGEVIGIDRTAMTKKLNGSRTMTLPEFTMIVSFLDISAEDLKRGLVF